MTKDNWLNIIDMVEAKFSIGKEYKEPLGGDIPGERHIIEFNGPMGKMKLEWVNKARVKDEKTMYANRVGSEVRVYKVYHENETVSYLNAYKWDEIKEDWEQIDAKMFGQ